MSIMTWMTWLSTFLYPIFSFTGKLQPWITNFKEAQLGKEHSKKQKALISNS